MSAPTSWIFCFNCSKLDSTHGSGWWLGKLPSLISLIVIISIGNILYNSFIIILLVPLPGSSTTFNFLEPKCKFSLNKFNSLIILSGYILLDVLIAL